MADDDYRRLLAAVEAQRNGLHRMHLRAANQSRILRSQGQNVGALAQGARADACRMSRDALNRLLKSERERERR